MSTRFAGPKLRALGVGLGAGLAGVVASAVLVLGVVGGIQAIGIELPLIALLLLAFALNQYFSFAGVALAYLRLRGAPLSYVGVEVPDLRDLAVVLAGYVGAFAIVFVSGLVIQATGVETANNNAAEMGMENPELLLLFVPLSFLMIGPCEELLFRGIVQRRLREAFSAPVAIAVAAAFFAAIHYLALNGPTAARLTSITILFFPSLVFGAAYEYTENIVVPALIHGAYNATLFSIMYVVMQFGDGVAALPF